jgi:hypothetical protein
MWLPPRSFSPESEIDADERPAGRIGQALAVEHGRADEGLLLRDQPVEMQVVRGGAAVDFGAGDVAFLDAQRAERLKAVGLDIVGFAGFHQRVPESAVP